MSMQGEWEDRWAFRFDGYDVRWTGSATGLEQRIEIERLEVAPVVVCGPNDRYAANEHDFDPPDAWGLSSSVIEQITEQARAMVRDANPAQFQRSK